MKLSAKAIARSPLLLSAKRSYWRFLSGRARHSAPKEVFDTVSALRCRIAYNKYGGYCVPLSSRFRPAAQRILSGDIYEPKTIDFLISKSGDGDVVHAGTYFGDFLPALSHACGPNFKIWAFEPNEENYRCAKITTLINDLDNVVLEHAGLGREESKQLLRIADEHGVALGGGSALVRDTEATSALATSMCQVRIVAVDDFVPAQRRVRVIQLDVEGFEEEALAGSLKTIRRWLPILVLEVWPGSKLAQSDWFSENILNLGYRYKKQIHDNYVFMCET